MAGTKAIKGKLKLLLAVVLLLAALVALTYFAGYYFEKRKYALDYPQEIIASADEYGLDRYLVAAVIYAESGGNPNAVSPQGAIGLMQIMPATGEWIAGKLNVEYSEAALYDPATNISFGCWYLSYLLNRFNGNTRHAVAAYNAGQGNVDKWLEDPELSPEGDLELIPFDETNEYVTKVLGARDKYEELYEDTLG